MRVRMSSGSSAPNTVSTGTIRGASCTMRSRPPTVWTRLETVGVSLRSRRSTRCPALPRMRAGSTRTDRSSRSPIAANDRTDSR